MRHVVCTLLQWLLTTVPVMASPPIEERDSILLSTLLTSEIPNLLENFGVPRAYRQGKFWLRISDGEEDNKMHLYRIDKRKYVIGTRMDEDGG